MADPLPRPRTGNVFCQILYITMQAAGMVCFGEQEKMFLLLKKHIYEVGY